MCSANPGLVDAYRCSPGPQNEPLEIGSENRDDAPVEADRAALAVAAKQGGVITFDQASACGLSSGAIRYRQRVRRWRAVARSAYRIIDMADPHDLIRAAITVLPNSVVSHEAAAEIHSIGRVRRGLAVVSVHTRTTHVFPGVTVHRNHDLHITHMQELGDLPCTTIPRTVIDLAGVLHPKHVANIVDDLITQKRLTVESLASVLTDVARRGKSGATTIRSILENRGTGVDRNATVLEIRGLSVLQNGGLPDPHLEYPIPWNPTRRFDACYPGWRIAIEWDSRRWHAGHDAFEQDRERDRSALLHGWSVYRFTWQDVSERPEHVVETTRLAIGRAHRSA